jgi:predicted ATPase
VQGAGQEWLRAIDARIAEAIWGLRVIDLGQGNLQKATEASELCLYFATRSHDVEMMLQAHHALWGVYIYAYTIPNPLQAVLEHTQKGLALYASTQLDRQSLIRIAGHDPAACAYRLRARAQWLLGYPDQAVATMAVGLALAEEVQDPLTTRQVLMSAAKMHYYRGEVTALLAAVEQFRQNEQKELKSAAHIDDAVLRGWALAQLGQAAESAVAVREACDLRIAGNGFFEMPFFLALLAEIYERAGDIEAMAATVQEALAIAEQSQEDHWRSELHRLAGRCRLAGGETEAAEASFLHAIELAQSQAIRSLELRAALDISRLWASQGEPARAYALLAGIYSWFSEGFDSADLRAAQQLLAKLATAAGISLPIVRPRETPAG